MMLSINSNYFLNEHQQVHLCNGGVQYFPCGTVQILKYY
jgi:hypothetical protein